METGQGDLGTRMLDLQGGCVHRSRVRLRWFPSHHLAQALLSLVPCGHVRVGTIRGFCSEAWDCPITMQWNDMYAHLSRERTVPVSVHRVLPSARNWVGTLGTQGKLVWNAKPLNLHVARTEKNQMRDLWTRTVGEPSPVILCCICTWLVKLGVFPVHVSRQLLYSFRFSSTQEFRVPV